MMMNLEKKKKRRKEKKKNRAGWKIFFQSDFFFLFGFFFKNYTINTKKSLLIISTEREIFPTSLIHQPTNQPTPYITGLILILLLLL